MQANGQGLASGRRPMTFLELRDRAQQIREVIAKQEATAMGLNNSRASVEQSAYLNQMQALAADVRSKKDLLTKVVQAMNQMQNSGNGSQGTSPGNM